MINGEKAAAADGTEVPYLRAANVQPDGLWLGEIKSLFATPKEIVQLSLRTGDLVVVEGGAGFGRSAVLLEPLEGWVFQNHIIRLRPISGAEPRFLDYCIKASLARGHIATLSNHATIPSLSLEKLAHMLVPTPSVVDQCAIADFLDRETAQIDQLIGKQNAFIELLGERRKAVIAQAVSKGLHQNVMMKDSRVEWLGRVPASWTISQIKWTGAVQRGASPRPIDDPKYFDDEGEWAWVRIADVTASDGTLRSTKQRLSELGSSLSVKLEPGSLILSIAGSVGKPCLTHIPACIHDGFVYFPKLPVDPKWLFRIFEAGQCFAGLGKMGTQLNLNTDTVGSIKIPLPPTQEVAAILSYLDVETGRIDESIEKASRLVRLLFERRSALITAAVTGKIDVRGAA